MNYEKFRIVASPYITDAYCECGNSLKEVSDGWFSSAMYCGKCNNIYKLKLIKMPKNKINRKFIAQCKKEVNENI
jgi:hypothetical protein